VTAAAAGTTAGRRRVGRGLQLALLAVPALFLAALFGLPVGEMLVTGLRPEGRWDLSVVARVVTDPGLRGVVWFTVWQATVSTVLTLVVGLPGAYAIARLRFPGRSLLRAGVTVPFVLPTVVVASAFLSVLGPRSPLNTALESVLGAGAPTLDLRRTVTAILIAHVFFNYAVVVRTVGGLWSHLDPRLEDAARSLGASRWRTFREVTLPLLRPAIASAAAIVFLFTFTSFGVVLILGGPGLATIEVEIHRYTTQLLDLEVASVLAILQLTAVVAALAVYQRLQRRRVAQPLARASGTAQPPRSVGQRLFLAANLLVMLVLLALPLLVLVERSLSTAEGYGLGNYAALASSRRGQLLFVPPWEAVRNSVVFALAATLISLVVGGLASVGVVVREGRIGRVFDTALMLPLGTSAVTIGFGFLIALDRPPLDLRGSALLVPLAQALVATPFVVRTLLPVLRAIDPSLREAAATLGAGPGRILREIDLPIVTRAGLVAAGFAFAVSVGEFGATVFISRVDLPTLPVAIFRFLGQPGALNFGQAMAMSTILMAVTATAVLLIERVSVGRAGTF
jgi:thiamine transport system permease protein